MGNMSNPCINRWGFNTFWHHFWYKDFDMAYEHKQDQIFSKLLRIFLFYGINLSYNIFANNYWYNHSYSQLSIKTYQRWITRKPNQFGEVVQLSVRKEADCIFPMKLWILKYSQWVVINQYWFQPIKKRRLLKSNDDPRHLDSITTIRTKNLNVIRKIKTVFSKLVLARLFKSSYYRF